MKKQRSAKVFTIMLAAMFWLTQQTWAQSATQSPQTQNSGSQQSASPMNTATAPDKAAPAASTTQPASQQKPAAGPQTAPQSSPQTAPAEPPPPKPRGTTVNTSEAPLQPVTTYPDASGAEQRTQPTQNANLPNAPQAQTQQPVEPQGAATAERVPTAGGAAAKPAGAAIAPAKQHRTRSILLKVGALAAAGVAAGTVYALSRGTSSTPPGASSPIAVPK